MTSKGGSADIYAETLAVFKRAAGDTEPLTTPEVAEALDRDRRTVYKRLRKLAERDELDTKKVGAAGRVWWRTHDESTAGADPLESDIRDDDERFIDFFEMQRYQCTGSGRMGPFSMPIKPSWMLSVTLAMNTLAATSLPFMRTRK